MNEKIIKKLSMFRRAPIATTIETKRQLAIIKVRHIIEFVFSAQIN